MLGSYQRNLVRTATAQSVWEGKRVGRNGTDHKGTVRAAHAVPGGLVKLTVDWDGNPLALSPLTDSEHVTIVRDSTQEA